MSMKLKATMATYPGRGKAVLDALGSISTQVDRVILVANEYREAEFFDVPHNVDVVFPENDLKDVGKFYAESSKEDYIFLCDDDIVYPSNYVKIMKENLERYANISAIVGVHGVTYADFFDGDPGARIVHVFSQALSVDTYVNQLGTGTVACRGGHMPTLEFMRSAARYVDVRFAAHCHRSGLHRICIAREAGWMQEIETGVSLFESFTTAWPLHVTAEVQEFGGFRHLPALFPEQKMAHLSA